jgi:hypothetical protein
LHQQDSILAPLNITVRDQLNHATLIETRRSNQTKASASAVRQRSRVLLTDQSHEIQQEESRHEFRQRLTRHVTSLFPSPESAQESMTGVSRQVRHTGLPIATGKTSSDARSRNKATLQQVAAQVCIIESSYIFIKIELLLQKFMCAKEKAFACFRGHLHPNAISAGISSLTPLQQGDFIIGFHPGRSGTIVLGEGQYYV